MGLIGIVLLVAGIGAIAVGVLRIRGPLAMIRHLDATDANLRRYEEWRGKRNSIDVDGPTGADVMRAHMRRRVILWGVVIAVGAVAAFAGLLLL